MAQGSSTLLELLLLPNPCSTMKAGRRSRTRARKREPLRVECDAFLGHCLFSGECDCNRFRHRAELLLEHLPDGVTVFNKLRAALEGLLVAPARAREIDRDVRDD